MTATAGSVCILHCSRERLPGKLTLTFHEATVRVMVQIGLIHAHQKAKRDDPKRIGLLENRMIFRRDFYADRPLKKLTDISEVKARMEGSMFSDI